MTTEERIRWVREQADEMAAKSKVMHLKHEHDSPKMFCLALRHIADQMERNLDAASKRTPIG